MASNAHDELSRFFAQTVCVSALSGLRAGSQLRVVIDGAESFTLNKEPVGTVLLESEPQSSPDLTFTLSLKALRELNGTEWADLCSLGIALVKKVIAPEEAERLGVKVHVGPWDLFTKGYFTILTQAGPGFMTFLASKGLVGISKIKQALERFKDKA